MTDDRAHSAQAQRLDADRLGALAAAEAPALFRMARSVVRDDGVAEDLVQAAFLRALERAEQFRGGDPAAWLRRILWNLAVDQARRGGREIAVDTLEERWADDAYTVDSAVVVARAETRAELEDAVIHLPFILRAAVVLHDVEGWTTARIAEAFGIGLPAAKQRLRRGRMALVTALAQGVERREALAGVPLRCWDARIQVSDYMNDELDEPARARLEAHLAACPTCPPLYASLVGVRASLGGLRDSDAVVPPGLVDRITGELGGGGAPARP